MKIFFENCNFMINHAIEMYDKKRKFPANDEHVAYALIHITEMIILKNFKIKFLFLQNQENLK